MNQADKQEFKIIHEKIDTITADIKFIKENLFNPHQGLWARNKTQTQTSDNQRVSGEES